jgi:NTE family protein
MSLGFAFSGCSGRAAFHLGAARRLRELDVRPTVVTGASSGALIAGATALDLLDTVHDSWRRLLAQQRLFQPRRILRGHWPFTMSHILRRGLDAWFGELAMGEVPIPIGIPVTTLGLRGRRVRIVTNADSISLSDAIAASCFIPGIYSRMVPIDGHITLDGAWARRTPTQEALDLGSQKLIAFVATPCGRLIGGLRRARVKPVPTQIRVLHPNTELPIKGFDFEESNIKRCFELGEDAAEHFVRRHESWLAASIG